jgi:hypothetical protein
MELTTHIHLAPKIRKCGWTHRAFITWCLTERAQGNTDFCIPIFLPPQVLFCGPTGQIRSRPPCFQASRSHTRRPHTIRHTQTHTHTPTHTYPHTHTLPGVRVCVCVTHLNESPTRRRGRYLHNTQKTTDEHPCSQLDSNPLSQQSSSCRPTP